MKEKDIPPPRERAKALMWILSHPLRIGLLAFGFNADQRTLDATGVLKWGGKKNGKGLGARLYTILWLQEMMRISAQPPSMQMWLGTRGVIADGLPVLLHTNQWLLTLLIEQLRLVEQEEREAQYARARAESVAALGEMFNRENYEASIEAAPHWAEVSAGAAGVGKSDFGKQLSQETGLPVREVNCKRLKPESIAMPSIEEAPKICILDEIAQIPPTPALMEALNAWARSPLPRSDDSSTPGVSPRHTEPDAAAKAASIFHHFNGLCDNKLAVKVYDALITDGQFMVDVESQFNCNVWSPFEAMDEESLIESIEALALSITARYEESKG